LTENIWRYLFSAATLILLLALAYHHWQIIVSPVPLDLYEGTMPLITGIIADGHNPYTFPFQPQAADVYPPLYNIIVAPLSGLFGNTFALHRSVSAVFIFIAVGLCYFATYKSTESRQHGAAAGVLLYAALLFYGTPVASTNALGVALFLAGVIVPWHWRFSTKSLLFGLVCGLLAFYTKQYFIVGIATLCLYLFLYVSMYRALLLGVLYAASLLISVAIVHATSPYYLDNTFFSPSVAFKGLQNWSILLLQLRVFVTTYSGLLAIIIISTVAAFYGIRGAASPSPAVTLFSFSKSGFSGPLLARKTDFFFFCLLWSTLVVVFALGRNPGNYMTYLFQLMSPFLLIVGFRSLARLPGKLTVISPLVLVCFFQSYAILKKDFSTDLHNWEKMEHLVSNAEQVLATQMLVMMLLEQGKDVHQDGHTFYFPLASEKPKLFLKEKKSERVSTIWRNYMTRLYKNIRRQEFDLILVSPWEMRGIFGRNPPPFKDITGRKFLERYYRVKETITLSMTDRYGAGSYDIQVWQPRAQIRPQKRLP